MGQVIVYSTSWCPECHALKRFLDAKTVPYRDVDIEQEFAEPREQLVALTGRRSVPQLVIGTTHVGGFDDCYALEHDGVLDALLEREGIAGFERAPG